MKVSKILTCICSKFRGKTKIKNCKQNKPRIHKGKNGIMIGTIEYEQLKRTIIIEIILDNHNFGKL